MREKFRLANLALLPSWHCDIACRHCVFESSPRVRGQLPIELAERVIAELRRWTTATSVGVSGGEAFTDFAYLKRIAQAAKKHGLALSVTTNGSFAEDAKRGEAMLRELRAIRLDSVTVSWDTFHAPFVSATAVRNLLDICHRLRIRSHVNVSVTRSHGLQEALAPLGDAAYRLPIIQFKCLPVGRAARKVRKEDLLAPESADMGRPCSRDFDTVSVTHDGAVYPCCAVGGFTGGIRLGNLHDESLRDLLHRRATELRWNVLARCGPSPFLAVATKEELGGAGLAEPQHDCVACHRLFSSGLGERLVERLKDRTFLQMSPDAGGHEDRASAPA